ncbi:hypothetical protein 2200_scaffold2352_00055 [Bacteriophage sp.]|nr:hypothetical protein 2200_scaffold2352_00055 [Bacteriophage sp.]
MLHLLPCFSAVSFRLSPVLSDCFPVIGTEYSQNSVLGITTTVIDP